VNTLTRPWAGLAAAACCVLFAAPAAAVLGQPIQASMAAASQAKVAAAVKRTQGLPAGVQVYEQASGDGGAIREYVSPQGVVFAVAWNTRFKPRLEDLLGSYHAGYAAAATEALKRPGIQRQSVLQAQDLVVRSTSHLGTFAGRAYVPSLVPLGFDAESAR
jgi:hypothetical protein